MQITIHGGFFYRGCRVECRSDSATVFLNHKQIGVTYASDRKGIERDIDLMLEGIEDE